MKILQPKVEAVGFLDLIAIGALKQVEEKITAPYIGNGTLWSGAIKGVAAGFIDGHGGKIAKYVSGAFAVDAGEDLAVALLGMAGGAASGITGVASSAQRDMTNAYNW